jgi:hypothetical protein
MEHIDQQADTVFCNKTRPKLKTLREYASQ